MKNYTITFLRHGESVANADGFRQGQMDYPLTDKGKFQAMLLADWWHSIGQRFDHVISSPLSRAKETTEIIAEKLGLDFQLAPLWMERDIGKLAGLPIKDAGHEFPKQKYPSVYQPLGEDGESQWDLFLRAANAISKLLQQTGGNILVVSHGGLLNAVMYVILGIVPQPNYRAAYFSLGNAAFSEVAYYPGEYRWQLKKLNENIHLNQEIEDQQRSSDGNHHLTLVRHGESVGNQQAVVQGQADYKLTKRGEMQIKSLAKYLISKKIALDEVISSPMLRTKRSAEILTNGDSNKIIYHDLWREHNIGAIAGKQISEVFNGTSHTTLYEPFQSIGGDGESRWALYIRAGQALDSIMHKEPGNYLIVSHGGIMNMVLCAALGITPRANHPTPGFHFNNAGVAQLSYRYDNQRWRFEHFNPDFEL
jgi:broad specificity phosphatase PhoE